MTTPKNVAKKAPPASARWKTGKPSQPDPPRGRRTTGEIIKLATGQGHGFIEGGDREFFFHRADAVTPFNSFAVGDVVSFEVIEDRLSGARAIQVKKAGRQPKG